MPSDNILIVGRQVGRAVRWPGSPEPEDAGEAAALGLVRRLEAIEEGVVTDTGRTWNERVSDLVGNEQRRAMVAAAQAAIDGVVEAYGVQRRRLSERLAKLLPAVPPEAAEIRAVVRAKTEDQRRSFIFAERQKAESGDRDALARLSALAFDPAGELISGAEREKLLKVLLASTDRAEFEQTQTISNCLDLVARWSDDARAFIATFAGYPTKSAYFAAESERQHRARMTFGSSAAPDSAA